VKSTPDLQKRSKLVQYTPCGGPDEFAQNPTTSFLTAAKIIYAIGAGITAAAGPCRIKPGLPHPLQKKKVAALSMVLRVFNY
jgi:hypothetical protein